MAEFCLDCWNKIMETNDPKRKYVLSRKPDFCEECGQWKPVFIRVKKRFLVAGWLSCMGKNKK